MLQVKSIELYIRKWKRLTLTRISIEAIIEKMEECENEFIATNFDYDSDDAYSSSNEDDDSDDEM